MEGVEKINYSDKGAGKIWKYKCFSQEGYGFIHIQNNETEATFREKVSFTNFDGLKFILPESGTSYDVEVLP